MQKMVKKVVFGLILAIFLINFVIAGISFSYPQSISYGTEITSFNWNQDITNISSCWYTLDGGVTNKTMTTCDAVQDDEIVSQEGNNTWIVYVNQTNGALSSGSISFWVDSIAPEISVTTPSTHPLSYTSSNTFNIIAILTETNTKKYNTDKDYKIEVLEPGWDDPAINYFNSGATFTYPPATPLDKDGDHTYVIYARDKYPNGTTIREVSVSGTIIRDTIDPTIEINSPLNGQNLSGNISISASASDERSGLANLSVLIEGSNTVIESATSTPLNFNWDSADFSDGQVNITATSTDRAGNSNSTKISIEIDNTMPQIYFNSPGEGTYNTTQLVDITASDAHLQEITLYVNEIAVNTTDLTELNYLLSEGEYEVYAEACDSFDNCNQTEAREIIIDLTAPVIVLNGSNPQYIEFGNEYSELSATASDNFDGDVTSSIAIDSSAVNASAIGSYDVFYTVTDSAGNTAIANRTVIVHDTTGPTITIISTDPSSNRAYPLGTSFLFQVHAEDLSGTASCTVGFAGADNAMGEDGDWYLSVADFGVGMHIWNATCTDNYGNNQTTSTYYFTILADPENSDDFDEYTNLSNVSDISNVSYFFVSNEFGSINFTQPIDFSSGFDWSNFINISFNSVDVDSIGAPQLNKTAIITIYNLTWTTPRILKNGAVCLDCSIISYINGTLIFSVTGFSTYTTEETTSDKPSGGGGSSHSSSACTTTWTCTEWSVCNEGTKTRTCTKVNSLCSLGTKPSETQSCDSEVIDLTKESESNTQTASTNSNSSPGITGGVIGSNLKGGLKAFLILMSLVLIALIAVKIIRRRSRNDIASRILLREDVVIAS
jgi:hypothetical protein